MRIDEKNYPALFHKGLIVDHFFDSKLTGFFTDSVMLAQKYVFYISKPTMAAVEMSFGKLLKVVDTLPNICRGLAFTTKLGHPHTMLYGLYPFEKDGVAAINIMIQAHAVDHRGTGAGVLVNGYFVPGPDGVTFYCKNSTLNDDQFTVDICRKALAIELFLTYAEIETRVCEPNWHIYEGPVCAYNNKTKHPITVVDSSWYTNLVVSGAFNVRGHFRLQPYGPERHQRRLQWIGEFQKNGYTRKAKKTQIENNE